MPYPNPSGPPEFMLPPWLFGAYKVKFDVLVELIASEYVWSVPFSTTNRKKSVIPLQLTELFELPLK